MQLQQPPQPDLGGCTNSPPANSRIHTAKLLTLSEDLPIIIEIVDTEEKIDSIMSFIDDVVQEGLVTRERVNVIKYVHNKKKNAGE